MRLIFCLLLALPYVARAENAEAIKSIEALPSTIIEAQNVLVKLNTCEKNWPMVAMEYGVKSIDLSPTTKMYVVPCAHWAVNYGVSIYVTVKESTAPDGYVVLQMPFTTFKNGTLVGTPLVHNVQFNPATNTLISTYYNNQSGGCGTAAAYVWNQGEQLFKLAMMKKYEDCQKPKEVAQWDDLILSSSAVQTEGTAENETPKDTGRRSF